MKIIYMFIYNICSLYAWVLLAIKFNHWWLALFSILTMMSSTTKEEITDDDTTTET